MHDICFLIIKLFCKHPNSSKFPFGQFQLQAWFEFKAGEEKNRQENNYWKNFIQRKQSVIFFHSHLSNLYIKLSDKACETEIYSIKLYTIWSKPYTQINNNKKYKKMNIKANLEQKKEENFIYLFIYNVSSL